MRHILSDRAHSRGSSLRRLALNLVPGIRVE
jgi:hypothetical protein